MRVEREEEMLVGMGVEEEGGNGKMIFLLSCCGTLVERGGELIEVERRVGDALSL